MARRVLTMFDENGCTGKSSEVRRRDSALEEVQDADGLILYPSTVPTQGCR